MILSIVGVIPGVGANLSGIRALRVLRALRLLRFIKELNVLITTLFKAMSYLLNAMILLGIMLLMFAIVGLQVFGGHLKQHCVDPQTGLYNTDVCCSLSESQGRQCSDFGPGWTCQVTPINPRYDQISFDNFAVAFLTVYQVEHDLAAARPARHSPCAGDAACSACLPRTGPWLQSWPWTPRPRPPSSSSWCWCCWARSCW